MEQHENVIVLLLYIVQLNSVVFCCLQTIYVLLKLRQRRVNPYANLNSSVLEPLKQEYPRIFYIRSWHRQRTY